MSRAIIVANGVISDYPFFQSYKKPDDFILCADGGFRHLCAWGWKPDVFLGDFDSINESVVLSHPLMQGVKVIPFQQMKNETDTHNAVLYALSHGYQDILMLGCTGTRLDHTLSNLHLLKLIRLQGGNGIILTEHNQVQVTDSRLEIHQQSGYCLSLIPMSEQVTGLTTQGLLYPLHNFTLLQEVSRGISNEFIQPDALITIKSGWLMVIQSRD